MSRLNEIESFIAVAHSGSITNAAAQLGVAKSAVSRRLADLEARLGVQLILRTTRQSSLTDEGAAYLLNATAALDALDAAEDDLHKQQCDLSGTLRVAAPASYGLTHLQPIFAKFLLEHPNVNLSVDFSDRLVDLVQDGFDLAIRIGAMTDSSLIASKVISIRMRCVASPAFWREHGMPNSANDLADLPFLSHQNQNPRNGVRYNTLDGQSGTIHPPHRVRASNGNFLAQMAVQGLGFTVDPDFVTDRFIADGQLQVALPDYIWPELDLFAVLPATRRATRRTRRFVDFLKQELRGNQALKNS